MNLTILMSDVFKGPLDFKSSVESSLTFLCKRFLRFSLLQIWIPLSAMICVTFLKLSPISVKIATKNRTGYIPLSLRLFMIDPQVGL